MGQIEKGLNYLKSIPSILKIMEFVALLISIGTVGYFLHKMGDYLGGDDKKGNLQFFIAVVVVIFVFAVALFSLFFFGLHEKWNLISWPLIVAIISIIFSAFLLVSSSLLADTAKYYKSKDICKFLNDHEADVRCGHLIAGTIFGFIAMILFFADAVLHFRIFKTGGASPQETTKIIS